MTTIERQAMVTFSAEKMFDLVNDIDAYGEFLPWCKSAKTLRANEHEVEGQIEVAKGPMHYTLMTFNTLERPTRMVMLQEEGPFKHFKGEWTFEALGEVGCKIHLHLEYEFASLLMNLSFGKFFEQAADSMLDAFCQRALEVCGD